MFALPLLYPLGLLPQHDFEYPAQLRVEMTQAIESGELLQALRSEIWLCVCKEVKASP